MKNNYVYITPFINGFDASYSELSDGITLKSAISRLKKPLNKKNKTIQIIQTGKYGGNYKNYVLSLRDLF